MSSRNPRRIVPANSQQVPRVELSPRAEEVKRQIENGTYEIDYDLLAERICDDICDEFATAEIIALDVPSGDIPPNRDK